MTSIPSSVCIPGPAAPTLPLATIPCEVFRFVYVLRLENGGYYVGCTRHLLRRLFRHFSVGGAMATRESRAVSIEQIYRFPDLRFGTMPVWVLFERFVASQWVNAKGPERVRGGGLGGAGITARMTLSQTI